MADYQMAEHDGALVVSIVGYSGPRLPLLQAFENCREGRCTCPTDQFRRLADLEADELDGRIELRLQPRPGAHLDLEQVRRCLETTLVRFEGVSI